jgi:hypothetical protein
MQFGRFHALAFLTFGGLLLLLQGLILFEGRSATVTKTTASEHRAETTARPAVAQLGILEYMPGVIGIIVVAVGATILVTVQRQVLEESEKKNHQGAGYPASPNTQAGR